MDRSVYTVLLWSFVFRVFTQTQATRLLGFPATGVLKNCLANKLIGRARVVASPPMPLLMPIFSVCPGAKLTAHFDHWAYLLNSREQAPARNVEVFYFTPRGTRLVGSPPPDLSKMFQLSHDLQIPEMLLATRAIEPELAEGWIGEEFFKVRHKGKLAGFVPDVVVLHPGGKPKRAVEFGGRSYGADRLRKLVEVCQEAQICAEVW